MKTSSRIEFAHLLRGLAALLVLLEHYIKNFWQKREAVAQLTNTAILENSKYPTPSVLELFNFQNFLYGGMGVAIFFLISGFVIPFSLHKSTTKSFMLGRITRLLPVYVIGFTICLLAIYFATIHFGTKWHYTTKEIIIHYIPGIRDLIWSKNIDGIIWTLEIEVKFYVICALAIPLFKKHSKLIYLIPVVLFCISLLLIQFIDPNKANRFFKLSHMFFMNAQFIIYMFIGVSLNFLYEKKQTIKETCFIIIGLFGMFTSLFKFGIINTLFTQLISAYIVALLIFTLGYAMNHRIKATTIFNFFANISYPLYVIHGVAGYILLRLLFDFGFVNPWVNLSITTFCAIFFAYIIHRYIEVPMQHWGKKLCQNKKH